jgi:hypothetical protein
LIEGVGVWPRAAGRLARAHGRAAKTARAAGRSWERWFIVRQLDMGLKAVIGIKTLIDIKTFISFKTVVSG